MCTDFSVGYVGRRGAGAQGCDCNATVVGSIQTRGNELLFLNIFISLPGTQAKAWRLVTQCLEKFSGKWGTECLNTVSPLPSLLHDTRIYVRTVPT